MDTADNIQVGAMIMVEMLHPLLELQGEPDHSTHVIEASAHKPRSRYIAICYQLNLIYSTFICGRVKTADQVIDQEHSLPSDFTGYDGALYFGADDKSFVFEESNWQQFGSDIDYDFQDSPGSSSVLLERYI